MVRIKVLQSDGEQIIHFDGGVRTAYKVSNGEISADETHALALLASLQGSQIMQEAPAKKEK